MLDLNFDFDIDIDSIEIDDKDARKHNVSRKAMVKYANLITKSVRYLEEIADFDLTEGTQYRIVTTKNMNALTAIYALLQNHEPEEIIIAIYRMNQPAVAKIISLSETVPISILISSFFRENKKYENWTRMLINAATEFDQIRSGEIDPDAELKQAEYRPDLGPDDCTHQPQAPDESMESQQVSACF